MTWLDHHLETFVRPRLAGEIPNVDPEDSWIRIFNAKTLIALNLIWLQTVKLAQGKIILLPGRDVFLFEVIARMMNDYPTIFRPDISSSVAPHVKEDYKHMFVLDTGYKGSIPKAMGIPNWSLVRYDYGGRLQKDVDKYQVFPKARSAVYMQLSGNLEGCPKYWHRAEMGGVNYKKVIQEIDTYSFRRAAMLTIHVAKSVKRVRPLAQQIMSLGRFV